MRVCMCVYTHISASRARQRAEHTRSHTPPLTNVLSPTPPLTNVSCARQRAEHKHAYTYTHTNTKTMYMYVYTHIHTHTHTHTHAHTRTHCVHVCVSSVCARARVLVRVDIRSHFCNCTRICNLESIHTECIYTQADTRTSAYNHSAAVLRILDCPCPCTHTHIIAF
jgi:hypothetical protein